MAERPILFNDAMVRAILSGAKTQTRRPVKRENAPEPGYTWAECLCAEIDPADRPCVPCDFRFGPCPFGSPGDTLWVRECFAQLDARYSIVPLAYRADGEPSCEGFWKWTPSIHMPRWASRLTLRVTDVRVERVQSISEADARAEGVERCGGFMASAGCWTNYGPNGPSLSTARESFASLWSDTYGPESWAANPWVWVVAFERTETDKDERGDHG